MKTNKLNSIRNKLLYISIFTIFLAIIILEISEAEIIEIIFSTILISLCINIISSLILIFLLDKRKEDDDKKKQLLIINNLIRTIKEFNGLIKEMYETTYNKPLDKNDENLKYIYSNIDKLYNQINKIDLDKKGYISVPVNYNNNSINIVTLSWHECYVQKLNEYMTELKNISIYYSFILDSELMISINKILFSEYRLKKMQNKIYYSALNKENVIDMRNGKNEKLKEVFAFFYTGLKGIIIETDKMCKYIDIITKKSNFLY